MKLIVGLGNPGEKYDNTRHNVGFVVIDKLIKIVGHNDKDLKLSKKFNSLILKTKIDSKPTILAKPITFMNNSGQAVQAISKYHKINHENIIIINDEIDLPLGRIKISKNSSAAGHNGVQSIINHLGTRDFTRIRIGIKHNVQADLANFVLKKFSKEEKKILKDVIKNAADAVITILKDDIETAMNKYN